MQKPLIQRIQNNNEVEKAIIYQEDSLNFIHNNYLIESDFIRYTISDF